MIGTRLGTWVIDQELGRGGMGHVYRAHEDAPAGEGRVAAVKVLAPELAQEEGFRQRFEREIEVLQKLNHPRIVRFYDAGVQDGHYYYVMEYLPGPALDAILEEGGRLTWKEVLDVALQLCPALKVAHDHGVIHRDLKPQNLLRAADGSVKLTDFGIATMFAAQRLTITGGLVGTAEYLSPEQAAGKPVTARSDLYSLGVVLYTLLTGRCPFEGETALELMHKHRYGQFDPPRRVVPDVPHELDEIVCSLLEKDAARRPANALMLQRQLESFRAKSLRREQQTMVTARAPDGTHADEASSAVPAPDLRHDEPGPATLMSRLMRAELDRQNRGGTFQQLLNQPAVLVVLFALCVGAIAWGVWPRSKTEEPAPTHVSAARQAYQQGEALYRAGDLAAARERWQDLVTAFRDVDGERYWVNQADKRLDELRQQLDDEHRWDSVRQALRRARDLDKAGKRSEAEAIRGGIERLYRNDPSAGPILDEIRKDRKAP